MMMKTITIPIFNWHSLDGRTLKVRVHTDTNTTLVVAQDIDTKDYFVLAEMPKEKERA